RYDATVEKLRAALKRDPDLDGGYYLLGRALFSAGRYQEVVDMAEEAMAHAGENYNTTIPIHNSLGALGKTDALKNYLHRELAMYEEQVKKVPEDARVRVLLAGDYAIQGRFEEAKREAEMAMILRPDDSMILYNVACAFCAMNNAPDALNAMRFGRVRIPTSLCCTANPNSSACTHHLPAPRRQVKRYRPQAPSQRSFLIKFPSA